MTEISCDISWFAERDVDIWLAEELRLNAHFARWFLNQVGVGHSVSAPAYRSRVSVCEGRETDVEALFASGHGSTFAVLIENKIKANFQPNQMEDYVKRGELGIKNGHWTAFAVAVFAPAYRFPIAAPSSKVVSITFENAANQIGARLNDTRSQYRAAFLKRAAQPYVFVAENENQYANQWWAAVNELVRAKFGDYFRPQTPCKTTYVNPRTADQASYIRVDLKGNQGEVALSFSSFGEQQLRSSIEGLADVSGISVVKRSTWKDPALQIGNLKKFEISDDLETVQNDILAAYEAAYRLLRFWKENRDLFDKIAAGNASLAS